MAQYCHSNETHGWYSKLNSLLKLYLGYSWSFRTLKIDRIMLVCKLFMG